MKNLFLALAFMLLSTVAFATNSNVYYNENQFQSELLLSVSQDLMSVDSEFTTLNVTLTTKDIEKNQIILKECHVKIKGTVNGKDVNIDIWFTSDSGSCIKDSIEFIRNLDVK